MVQGEILAVRDIRLTRVLGALGISRSSRSARCRTKGGSVGRVVEQIDESVASGISEVAKSYPCWGYRRIAVVCQRSGLAVSDRLVYKVM